MVRIDVSNYCSWMDTWCTWTPLSSIDIWLVKNESLEEVEKKKKYDETNADDRMERVR